jgi:ribonuclease HII
MIQESKKSTIKEIKYTLEKGVSSEYIDQLLQDSRRGVQNLVTSYLRKQSQEQIEQQRLKMMWQHEEECQKEGISFVAGVDEVGRGPLAGPVVAAAVILPANFNVNGMKDSKKLQPQDRIILRERIEREAVSFGTGFVDVDYIDTHNILQATYEAMRIAISKLHPNPQMLLVDAINIPSVSIPQKNIIKGDELSHSIAAASIIAKTVRDEYMVNLAKKYPNYAFDQHMGYGTPAHLEAIAKWRPSPVHRKSFSPVARTLASKK